MRRLVLPLAALVVLAAPAAAQATQRYAAPGGSGEACSQSSPCSLEVAIEKAQANDEVIVTGGTYTVASNIMNPEKATNLYVHGDFAGPPPIVSGTAMGALIPDFTLGSRVAYLDIRDVSPEFAVGIGCGAKATVDRVRISVTGKYSEALTSAEDCYVHDSLLLASGEYSVALSSAGYIGTSTEVVRNVTAIATGTESVGVRSSYVNPGIGPGAFTIDLKNSIAGGQGADLLAIQGIEGPGDIAVANSNFDLPKAEGTAAVINGGGNQTAPPIFVDAELGDYTEAAASPTVDAGVVDQLGPLDLAGRKRVQGPAPDIGAYEMPVPKVECACPPLGGIRSLSIRPKRFRPKKGALVTFGMSGPSKVQFSVSKKIEHSKSYRPLKGSFTRNGKTGANHFTFHGRIGGKTLTPGRYKLTGLAGHLVSAGFSIRAPAPRGGAR